MMDAYVRFAWKYNSRESILPLTMEIEQYALCEISGFPNIYE